MTTPPVAVKPVSGPRATQAFLDVPHLVYADDRHWVPPLRLIERERLTPGKHPFYRHGKGEFWVAYRDGKPVGRIGAVVNDLHIEKHADATGHFSMLEFVDDVEVSKALVSTAEKWLASHGMQRIAGPYNLSINEELGVLVEGFSDPPMIMMGHARPYYSVHLETLGFSKDMDLLAYRSRLGDEQLLPDRLKSLENKLSRFGVDIRYSSRQSLKADIAMLVDVYNDAWAENWGAIDITPEEARKMAKDLSPVIVPEGIVVAEIDKQPIAVFAAIPNLNEALVGLGGRLLPFGWVKFLWRLKVAKAKTGRLFLAGVRKKYQNSIIGAALVPVMLERVRVPQRRLGIQESEISWILESNLSVRKFCEAAGLTIHKRYRIYGKSI